MIRTGLLAAVAISTASLVAACSPPAAAVDPGPTPIPRQDGCSAPSADALCVLIVGDSLAYGAPLTGANRWGPQLRELLRSALPDRRVEVDNWGVSGAQIHVLESAARDQPALGSYDVAIVIEGVNDAHLLTIDVWRERYEAAIESLEASGLVVIVTTPPPRFERGAFDPRYDGVAAAVREVAGPGRPLLDLASRWRADGAARAAAYYDDAIHPGVDGQKLMAKMARDAVLAALGTR